MSDTTRAPTFAEECTKKKHVDATSIEARFLNYKGGAGTM